jgi:hypothetical protein
MSILSCNHFRFTSGHNHTTRGKTVKQEQHMLSLREESKYLDDASAAASAAAAVHHLTLQNSKATLC